MNETEINAMRQRYAEGRRIAAHFDPPADYVDPRPLYTVTLRDIAEAEWQTLDGYRSTGTEWEEFVSA